MPCFSPLQAWRAKAPNESGKFGLVFSRDQAQNPENPIDVPCGQCIGCRLEKSRQWAVRCVHEASLHDDNCFITLTFDNEHLQKRDVPWSINKRDVQLFMKRLRKKFFGNKQGNIKYYACGEYGDINKRPHYHILLFNFNFCDRTLYSIKNNNRYYISDALNELWPYGFSIIGDVTYQSSAYVARYCMKKITGDMSYEHYKSIDTETGEIHELEPEFSLMSRRPAIGKDWFDVYHDDLYPSDYCHIDGKRHRIPSYYDRLLDQLDDNDLEYIKELRVKKAMPHKDYLIRLRDREKVTSLKTVKLIRPVE